MTIHKGNIEAYLLDYIEGNLDALLTAELMAFLSENPEYEKWIPEYDGHVCLEAGPVFEDKPILRKDYKDVPLINELNFDEFCIASTEGLLEKKDQARLDEYLEMHPERQRDLDVYAKLVLQPDYLVVYPNKKGLKKRLPAAVPLRFVYYAIGIAASVAVLLLLVSRKPADHLQSAKIPERPATRHEQETIPAPEPEQPVVSPETMAALPLNDRIIKHPDTPDGTIVPPDSKTGIQPLASIEPLKFPGVASKTARPGIHKLTRPTAATVLYPESSEIAYSSPQTPAKILGSIAKKLNLWKAAEKAVTGFNYLTESRLSLVKTTDENGKFSSLSLQSEDYTNSDNKVK
jgi:hypothetical protein